LSVVAAVVPGLAQGLTLALCVAACATTVRPKPEWVKTRESAEDFERAREACKQQALTEVSGEYRGTVAAEAGAGTFFKCMANKGWKQAPRAEATPAAR
jgi:hypothetical protein